MRTQVEAPRHGLVVVDPRSQIGGNAVLGQVTEIIHEIPDQIGNPLTEREQLLELVEDDHRCERIVLRAPEFEVFAVQILPERFVFGGQQRIGHIRPNRVVDGLMELTR